MIRPFVFAALLAVAFPAFAEDMSVMVGQVTTVDAGADPGTVVIGDPKIADVAVEGRTVMIFGKAIGATDLVVFDPNREILFASRVQVGLDTSDLVTVNAPGLQPIRWTCSAGRCLREIGR